MHWCILSGLFIWIIFGNGFEKLLNNTFYFDICVKFLATKYFFYISKHGHHKYWLWFPEPKLSCLLGSSSTSTFWLLLQTYGGVLCFPSRLFWLQALERLHKKAWLVTLALRPCWHFTSGSVSHFLAPGSGTVPKNGPTHHLYLQVLRLEHEVA